MKTDFDIAIVGSGFGGSLMAMIARRLGRSVILLERGRHPRFAIGESSTPLTNLILEELSRRYDLPEIEPLSKWGTWQATYPKVVCGLKRGFSFFHHTRGLPWKATPDRCNELLVAASPRAQIADTHWYRPDFDQFLVQRAQQRGAEYLDEFELKTIEPSEGGLTLLGQRHGKPQSYRARFVIDASGPRGFLWRTLALGETGIANFPQTHALYSHFENVGRWQSIHSPEEEPPFPVDDAALHHVFDGGWIWVLRFNNGITSAGVAATDDTAREFGFNEGQAGWERLLRQLPSVRAQFENARAIRPFVHTPALPFRSNCVAGNGWALLPSAAGFVDPLLSTGFPLTLLGIERLALNIERHWASAAFEKELSIYETRTLRELDATAALIAALYRAMPDFPRFAQLTLPYFAAAMFSETWRRLGRTNDAGSFLLCDHPGFEPILAAARFGSNDMQEMIEPFNLARLGDPELRNWHPCRGEDLIEAAPKIGASAPEIQALLDRCGFYQADDRTFSDTPARSGPNNRSS